MKRKIWIWVLVFAIWFVLANFANYLLQYTPFRHFSTQNPIIGISIMLVFLPTYPQFIPYLVVCHNPQGSCDFVFPTRIIFQIIGFIIFVLIGAFVGFVYGKIRHSRSE